MPRALTILQVLSADPGKVHLFQHMGCWCIFHLLLETASRERGTRCSRSRRARRQRGWHRGEGSKRPPHGPGRPGCGTQRAALLQKGGGYRRVPKASSPGQGQVGSGIRDPGPSPVRAATRGHRAAAAAASNPARLPPSAPVLWAVRAWFS